jgi:type IV pilus assembly protein PilP
MRNRTYVSVLAAVVLGMAMASTACGDNMMTNNPPPPPQRVAPVASADADASAPMLKGIDYAESDFVESEQNRDPFRNFIAPSTSAVPRVTTTNQRDVKLGQYAIDELKLIAIVGSGEDRRAMFVDPEGKGWMVTKGNFICKPEIVRSGTSGPEYQVNWRANTTGQPPTRVIPLHPEGGDKRDPRRQRLN